jgi:hypothetical protein
MIAKCTYFRREGLQLQGIFIAIGQLPGYLLFIHSVPCTKYYLLFKYYYYYFDFSILYWKLFVVEYNIYSLTARYRINIDIS